jgi:hypothetical protein
MLPAASAQPEGGGVILYARHFGGGDSGFCVTDPQGNRTALLKYFDDRSATAPAWSSDGERIAFEVDGEVAIMNADGSNETVVTGGRRPSWSPDDSSLVFGRDGNIVVIDADGTDERTLQEGHNPDWSPDGERIAYERIPDPIITDGPEGELKTMGLEGEDVEDHGYGQEPDWSPDGTKIAYAVHTYWGSDLAYKEVDGEGGRALTQTDVNADRPSDPDWAPDGTSVVYPRQGELWVVPLGQVNGYRILKHAGSADWGHGPIDDSSLWEGRSCGAPKVFISLRLTGHLFARGRVWTNDPERCSIGGLRIDVMRRENGGDWQATRTRSDASGRYSVKVRERLSDGTWRTDAPGRYKTVVSSVECFGSGSRWKRHDH